jgi:acyl-coenzyme A synthetase/AMP-(fatty) acid ligase
MTPFEEMALIEKRIREDRRYRNFADFSGTIAEARGERPMAIWFERDEQLTYSGLERKSNALADSLQSLGVRKGTHVGMLLASGPECPVTWFALAKLGAVAVQINSNYTTSEIAGIVDTGDVDWLVVGEEFLDRLSSEHAKAPNIDRDRLIVAASAPRSGYLDWHQLVANGNTGFSVPYDVGGDTLLNLQFTSGTTGMPKGCMLSQDYWLLISQLVFWRLEETEVRRSLIWPPFHYLDGQRKFVEQMRSGTTMYIPQKMRLSKLLDWIWDYGIEYAAIPEPLLMLVKDSPRDREIPLRFADCYGWTGEKRRIFEKRFNATIRDTYGMTEVGIQTFLPLSARDQAWKPTCGLVAPFCQMKVVDDEGNQVPDGEIGELWVSGDGLMQGYYRRPDANRQSFVGKWFRTGDLFRRSSDGFFFFEGRIKDMIKRAGENIAAVEVESVAKQHSAVAEVAVIGVKDDMRGEEVKMFVRLTAETSDTQSAIASLASHLSENLARFKCPRFYATVSDFPRTAVGKIEKRTLREGTVETLFELDVKQ